MTSQTTTSWRALRNLNHIVSEDNDLLRLERHGARIVTSAEMLRVLRGATEAPEA